MLNTLLKWFICQHDYSVVHTTTTLITKKVNNGTLHLTRECVVKVCSACGKKKVEE